MKMKSFAMLALSGLLTASLAYIAPAMAEDMNNNGSTMQQAPSDTNSGAGSSQGSDNMGGSNDQNNSGGAAGSQGSSSDQGSPDTATGDDDY
jgi:hypothetical protein